jgi:hypothetical protein
LKGVSIDTVFELMERQVRGTVAAARTGIARSSAQLRTRRAMT